MNKLHILLLGAYMSCLGQNLMAAATAEPASNLEGRFLITTRDKQDIADIYHSNYFSPARKSQGIVKNLEKHPESYVVQKIIGLNLLTTIAQREELYLLPLGRLFKTSFNIQTLTGDTADTAFRYQFDLEGVNQAQISRLAGVIVYNNSTGGMIYIDVNIAGSEVFHVSDYIYRGSDPTTPSQKLALELTSSVNDSMALKTLQINMEKRHKLLLRSGDAAAQLAPAEAEENLNLKEMAQTTLTSATKKIEKHLKDVCALLDFSRYTTILTQGQSIGIIPLSPTKHPYTITFTIDENKKIIAPYMKPPEYSSTPHPLIDRIPEEEFNALVARLKGIKITINPSAIGLEFGEAIRAAQPAAAEDAATPLLPGREPSFEDAGGAADGE